MPLSWFGAFGPKHIQLVPGQVLKLQVSDTYQGQTLFFTNTIRNKPPAHLNSIYSCTLRLLSFTCPAAQAHQILGFPKVTNLNSRLKTLH